MSVLVFIETEDGKIKPSSLEAVVYGSKMSAENVTALVFAGVEQSALADLGSYGVHKVLVATDERFKAADVQALSTLLAAAAAQENSKTVVMARSSLTDSVASRLSVKMEAAVATNVVSLPDTASGFQVKRSIFTGKAFAMVRLDGEKRLLTIKKNTVSAAPLAPGNTAEVVDFAPEIDAAAFSTKCLSVEKVEGDILLPEADRVVSGGRGLKGPENWAMIETLAKTLGAATACSKPVSDMDWRPHHEHVGQTGIKVSPNLYIAVGISGAIQHLAGVNASKVIVVINKDPEAPFFKAADYGIVGDAFEVIPKLNEALKNAISQ